MRIEKMMNDFEERLFEMGDLCHLAMSKAMQAFMESDKELALQVVEGDKIINYHEEVINDQAIEILTLMQPVAKDLRLLIGGIKAVNDLERIGDYAKNISRFVINSNIVDDKYVQEVLNLTKLFLKNFTEVLNVLKNRDTKEAYRVASLDSDLDVAVDKFVKMLAFNEFKNDLVTVELNNIVQNIERAGDHAKNICEQVIYIEKGRYIDFG